MIAAVEHKINPFQEIARDCSNEFPDDVQEAVQNAISRAKKHPEYTDYVDLLAELAIQEYVYRARTQANYDQKRGDGSYAAPQKVHSGTSSSVNDVHLGVLAMRIAGTTLGALTIDRLEEIADSERQIANGHDYNARLLDAFRVKADAKIKRNSKLKDRPLSQLFKSHEAEKIAKSVQRQCT